MPPVAQTIAFCRLRLLKSIHTPPPQAPHRVAQTGVFHFTEPSLAPSGPDCQCEGDLSPGTDWASTPEQPNPRRPAWEDGFRLQTKTIAFLNASIWR